MSTSGLWILNAWACLKANPIVSFFILCCLLFLSAWDLLVVTILLYDIQWFWSICNYQRNAKRKHCKKVQWKVLTIVLTLYQNYLHVPFHLNFAFSTFFKTSSVLQTRYQVDSCPTCLGGEAGWSTPTMKPTLMW